MAVFLNKFVRLKVDNRKKAMVLSFNFLEVGKRLLSRCCTWFVPIVLRHEVIEKAIGGWPRLLKLYLEKQILDSRNGLSTSGVVVTLFGAPCVFFARLTNLVSDGDGLKVALDWRGANSMKPSFRHSTILKLGSNLDIGEDYVEIDCHDSRKILGQGWNQAEFEATVDLIIDAQSQLTSGRLSPAAFEKLCFAHGLNWNEHGLILTRGRDASSRRSTWSQSIGCIASSKTARSL